MKWQTVKFTRVTTEEMTLVLSADKLMDDDTLEWFIRNSSRYGHMVEEDKIKSETGEWKPQTISFE